jgi:N-acetylmuramoyl-L-alanine amidase
MTDAPDPPPTGSSLLDRRAILLGGLLAAGTLLGAAAPVRHPLAAPPVLGRARPPLPLVMLDPGHGGKDPGAIGVTGTYEKHVAFAAAQSLRRLLLAGGKCRAQLTRTRDVFVRLDDRVGIARRAGAALFVSMHADALPDRGVRGASVYTLSDTASDAQTAALAVRENSADRFAGPGFQDVSPEVARILGSLVRRETRVGAARLSRGMVQAIGADVPLLSNPARHARFAVLRAADIPSALVEMGFMSNPRDEAALRTETHRLRVTMAMRRAIESFIDAQGAGLSG